MEKKVLQLSVSKQWFDMISAGVKTEEYREIKPYWIIRLFDIPDDFANIIEAIPMLVENHLLNIPKFLEWASGFTHILFINGYGDDKPRVEKEIESITIGKPKKGMCPDEFLDMDYFVIKLK